MNVLVSRCLIGEPCRWHGRKLSASSFVKRWVHEHPRDTLVPVCPELLAGLGCPRPPVKRSRGRVYTTCADKALRAQVTGDDVTDAFISGAASTVAIALERRCTLAILCKWSPSCDKTGIAGKMLAGVGIEIVNTF